MSTSAEQFRIGYSQVVPVSLLEEERNNDVVASLAVTIDGYVCRSDGSVDYLEKYSIEDFDFDVWVGRVGALVMGSATYLQTIGWGWEWGDRPTLVLTTQTDLPVPPEANVSFSAEATGPAIESWARSTPNRTWVFGGGQVVTAALAAGVVDTLDITVMPVAIGSGLPLFTEAYDGPMRAIMTVPYSNGAVRLVYDTKM